MSRLSAILRILPEYQTYKDDAAAVNSARRAMHASSCAFERVTRYMVAVKMRDASRQLLCAAITHELAFRVVLGASGHLRASWHRGTINGTAYHDAQAILTHAASALAEVL